MCDESESTQQGNSLQMIHSFTEILFSNATAEAYSRLNTLQDDMKTPKAWQHTGSTKKKPDTTTRQKRLATT